MNLLTLNKPIHHDVGPTIAEMATMINAMDDATGFVVVVLGAGPDGSKTPLVYTSGLTEQQRCEVLLHAWHLDETRLNPAT